MAAPVGNRFWEARTKHGRPPIYPHGPEGAQALWEDCVGYFQWVEENPLIRPEPVKYEGHGSTFDVGVPRPMTIMGLCLYLGITEQTWQEWRRERDDLTGVITRADLVIRENKFSGAAANLFNPNIIARDLGLSDKSELKVSAHESWSDKLDEE